MLLIQLNASIILKSIITIVGCSLYIGVDICRWDAGGMNCIHMASIYNLML